MFLKEAYRVGIIVLFITETITYVLLQSVKLSKNLSLLGQVSMPFKLIVINQQYMIVYRVEHLLVSQ